MDMNPRLCTGKVYALTGMTVKRCMKILGVTRQRVHSLLKEGHLLDRLNGRDPREYRKSKYINKYGRPARELAEELNTNMYQIRKWHAEGKLAKKLKERRERTGHREH